MGDVTVLQLLLKDPRVDVNLRDHEGRTLLWLASLEGHFSAVEWLIASKRDLEVNLKGHLDGQVYIALDIARVRRKNEVVTLLERFTANPAQTRHEVRVKLGVLDECTAEVFALVVFLCDDLQLRPPTLITSSSNPAVVRFFMIAAKLPMELQMMLCHRAVGSMKQNILHQDSEAAFKSLAGILLPPPSAN